MATHHYVYAYVIFVEIMKNSIVNSVHAYDWTAGLPLQQKVRSTVDTLVSIELQLYEKLWLWDQDMWNVIPLFASCLTLY